MTTPEPTERQIGIRTDAEFQMRRAGVPDAVREQARAVHESVEALRRTADECGATTKHRMVAGDVLARAVEREMES